jgi:signal transduction histidine kinase
LSAGALQDDSVLRSDALQRVHYDTSSAVTTLASEAVEHRRLDRNESGPLNACERLADSVAADACGLWEDRPLPPDAASLAAMPSPLSRDLCGLLDSLSGAVFLLDAGGRILFRNPAAASLVDDAGGLRRVSLLHCEGELWRCALELLAQALSGYTRTKRNVTLQQPTRCWEVEVRELQNSVSGARRFALLLHDVTEQEGLKEELRLSEAMGRSGLLLAGAAHQAKNVLFGLSATLEALQIAHSSEIGQQNAHVQNLKDGIARMEAMVRNVFAQSRPRGQYTSLWVSAIVGEAVRGCAQLATQRNVNICTGLFADARIRGNAQPLIQAMENLIDNAVRYSPDGSTVTVDVEAASDGQVSIRIADHGTGFRPQDADNLFRPFFTRRPGGTGLGLAVARHIVEEHTGDISLANSETGGAVVTVRLPSERYAKLRDASAGAS